MMQIKERNADIMKIKWLKDFINSPTGERLVGGFAYYYLKFVGFTTRWQSVTGVKETYEMLEKHGSMIVIGWHGRTLEMPYFWNKTRPLNALVSPHRDGRIIVHVLKKFGIGNINGSSDKNSTEAAIELMRNLQQGKSIAIIPDGPRGPVHSRRETGCRGVSRRCRFHRCADRVRHGLAEAAPSGGERNPADLHAGQSRHLYERPRLPCGHGGFLPEDEWRTDI